MGEDELYDEEVFIYEEEDDGQGDASMYEENNSFIERNEPSMPENDPDEQKNVYIKNESYCIFGNANKAKAIHSLQILRDSDDMLVFSTKPDPNNPNNTIQTVDFTGRNTWNHYRLIPSSRPVINPPEFRSSFIEIPGADGLLDTSTTLSGGHPLYGRRKGDIEFYVTRDYDNYYSWAKAYSNIMAFLHGQTVKCILMDDPSFYYRGRMTVNQWRSEKDWSKIVLNYDFEPYKYAVFTTADRWLWDPFDFAEGVTTDPINFVGSDGYGIETGRNIGPDFTIYAGSMRSTPSIIITNLQEVGSGSITYDTLRFNVGLIRGVKGSDGSYTYPETSRVGTTQYINVNAKRAVRKDGELVYTKTMVSPYFLSVKNGMYRVSVHYASGTPDRVKIGLSYRYGSL